MDSGEFCPCGEKFDDISNPEIIFINCDHKICEKCRLKQAEEKPPRNNF